jgi:hypothetical protein
MKFEASFGCFRLARIKAATRHIIHPCDRVISAVTANIIVASCRPPLRRMTSSNKPHGSPILRMNKIYEANFGWGRLTKSKLVHDIFYIHLIVLVYPIHSRMHFRFLSATVATSDVIQHTAWKSHSAREWQTYEANFGWVWLTKTKLVLEMSYIYLIVGVPRVTADHISANCRPPLRRVTSSNIPYESPILRVNKTYEANFGLVIARSVPALFWSTTRRQVVQLVVQQIEHVEFELKWRSHELPVHPIVGLPEMRVRKMRVLDSESTLVSKESASTVYMPWNCEYIQYTSMSCIEQ